MTSTTETNGLDKLPIFTEIIAVRHGETARNASRVLQGHLDTELNETGRQQATAVADRLFREPKVAGIYSSDLKRAAETANIIANICNLPEVRKTATLRERNLGDIQGLSSSDATKLKPEAYKIFVSTNRDGVIPGGGESLNQLKERSVSCFERIAKKHKGIFLLYTTQVLIL
ncbi:phosphoglycerate mutase-like protein 4 [Canna indica]|uniref:Phosphoglycerate mutase-like protein 4 n=1 Tax=Canna indica TaxID=4628 RepID=A0AAQ3JNA3_9LILI|nr:phosphoglycerate mutase-like protein 4 [Canna indica]